MLERWTTWIGRFDFWVQPTEKIKKNRLIEEAFVLSLRFKEDGNLGGIAPRTNCFEQSVLRFNINY